MSTNGQSQQTTDSVPPQPKNVSEATFQISGMTCAACVRRVERAILKTNGVLEASVNLATEQGFVRFDNSLVAADEIAVKISESGYEASLLSNLSSEPNNTDLDSPGTGSKEAEFAKHATRASETLWNDFVGSLIFTAPLFLISMVPMLWPPLMDQMMKWMPMEQWNIAMLLLCIPVQFWFGRRFLTLGVKSLINGSPDMNTLVMLGTGAAFAFSFVVTLWPQLLPPDSRHVYFESAAVVITLVLLGRYLEGRSRNEAGHAMRGLLKLQPSTARVSKNNSFVELPIDTICINDLIEVRPGESVPLDGRITTGTTSINESMVTGEAIPIDKGPGDMVIGGTLNQNGNFQFQVTSVGNDTTLSKIIQFVERAQASKPKIQSLADQVVAYFVPVVLAIALLTAVSWMLITNQIAVALVHSVAVLIIACPCAMGLAVPTSVMVGSGRAAQLGVLFRQSTAIESLANANTFVVDKTGTVTKGKPAVTRLETSNHYSKSILIPWIIDVQNKSEHPIGKSIVQSMSGQYPGGSTRIKEFKAVPGFGIEAIIEHEDTPKHISMGSERLMQRLNVSLEMFSDTIALSKSEGASLFYVAVDGEACAVFALEDTLKPDSKSAIDWLTNSGGNVFIFSGDQKEAVARTAAQVGLSASNARGEMQPEEKAIEVKGLKKGGATIAFVGDGINDAPALVAADVGVAIGTGTDLAIESADVVLMSGELTALTRAVELSRTILANIRQNLAWAFGYNILLIPLATGLLEPMFGWKLSPMHAAVAMSLSSFFVVSNSLRLRNFKPSM